MHSILLILANVLPNTSLERKPVINKLLMDAGSNLKKDGIFQDNETRGTMLIEFYKSRRYIQKILWGLSLEELNEMPLEEVQDLWIQALINLKNRPQPEKKILQVQEFKRPRGRPRKTPNIPS